MLTRKIVHITEKEIAPEFIYPFALDGDHILSRLPVNWQKIDPVKAAKRMASYQPAYILYGNCNFYFDGTPVGRTVNAHFYLYSDRTGLAVEYDFFPEEKVTWYSFGCEHDLQPTTAPSGATMGCSKCGFLYHPPDSSG